MGAARAAQACGHTAYPLVTQEKRRAACDLGQKTPSIRLNKRGPPGRARSGVGRAATGSDGPGLGAIREWVRMWMWGRGTAMRRVCPLGILLIMLLAGCSDQTSTAETLTGADAGTTGTATQA